MSNSTSNDNSRVAGVVHATCSCCDEPLALVPHLSIGGTRLACPKSRSTYLDRGDGVYEPDGASLDAETRLEPGEDRDAAVDLLSDRPVRTGPKTRINLERATFAGRV